MRSLRLGAGHPAEPNKAGGGGSPQTLLLSSSTGNRNGPDKDWEDQAGGEEPF